MPCCSVYGCRSRQDDKNNRENGIFFHRFPNRNNSPKRFAKWLEYCKRKAFNPTSNSRVCSKHFKKSDFDESQLLKLKLMPNEKLIGPRLNKHAIPSAKLLASAPTVDAVDNQPGSSHKSSKRSRKRRCEAKRRKEHTTEETQVRNVKIEAIMLPNFNESELVCELKSEMFQDNSENEVLNNSFCREITRSTDSEVDNSDGMHSNDQKNEIIDEEYSLVAWSCLRQLFEICNACSERVNNIRRYIEGTVVCVKTTCDCGESRVWCSQPIKDKHPE